MKLEETQDKQKRKDIESKKKNILDKVRYLKKYNEEVGYRRFLKRIGVSKQKQFRLKISDDHQPFNMYERNSRIPLEDKRNRLEKLIELQDKLKHLYEEKYGKKLAKKIIMDHNMLQRLTVIRKHEKKIEKAKFKEENFQINYETDIVTLSNLIKSDVKKFLNPQDIKESNLTKEDADYFLKEILGFEEGENLDFSNPLGTLPPIVKTPRKRGALKNKHNSLSRKSSPRKEDPYLSERK